MNHLDNMTSDVCTGCSACENICQKDAIELKADKEGFLIPKINMQKCIDCGQCVNVCQIKASCDEVNYENTAFAVKYKNDEIRRKSSSGAYFQALARYFISNNGYVCGCVLDNMKVEHIVSNQDADLERMADSKYVQSDLKNCFYEIGNLLENKIPVLFSGTSCQVAGLKLYLKNKKINANSLLTVDFFCHGVPSPLIWEEYLKDYEKLTGRKPVDFKWRCKDYGWGKMSRGSSYLNTVIYKPRNKDRSVYARSWRLIFFSNLVLRKKCHNCDYCKINKPADITMGDFWGIEKILPEFDDGKGASVIIVHDPANLKYVTELTDLEYRLVDTDEAVKGQLNAFQPSKASEQREEFWQDYYEKGFDYTFRKYIYTNDYIIKSKIKMILFLLGFRNYN